MHASVLERIPYPGNAHYTGLSMATLLFTASPTTARSARSALWFGVPWFVWVSAFSIFCAAAGLHFDVSWHRSIGRDSFWNPAHIVLYLSGVTSAVYCAYLLIATTWGRDHALRSHSVTIWGLRAPIGVFAAAWGGIGMLYDATFDNWWHNAYGLDVRFASPPHLLFSLSLIFEMLGALLLAFSYLNRAQTEPGENLNTSRLKSVVLFMGGLIAVSELIPAVSCTWDTNLHGTKAYIAIALALPIWLAIISRVTRHRWTCTIITAIYTAFLIALILFMPLFRATPRLGPIYEPVTHFIPPRFPLLLIIPAIALDLLWRRDRPRKILNALLSGALFIALFAAAEWPFANFLLSPASDNRFFGTRYLGFDDFTIPPGPGAWRFEAPSHGLHLLAGLATAAVIASIGFYAGNLLGNRLRTIRR